jgi:ATP-dependent helicase/nuclease subunit A
MTESRRIDQQSRDVIRKDLLTNLLVEAGAGSGKTQMLAERMAAGIAVGAYQIQHLAAVTFTRKAASELRGRFHLALEDKLASSDIESALRIRHALSNLERFFAGTIHSFCARLLRERPVESGISPGFSELDEAEDVELRKRSWREFIAIARSGGDPVMMDLLAAGVRPGDLDSAFATICLNDEVQFPPGEAVCPDPKAAWNALDTFWKELQKHLPATIDPATSCPIQEAAREFVARMRVSRQRLDRPAVIAELLKIWDCKSKITQKWWATSSAEKTRFKNLIVPLHEDFRAHVVAPNLSQWRQYIYRLSVTLLTRAREDAAAERRRLNRLNYGDLLNLTAQVLRTNADVRRALQDKYRYLFVDEFQDTDSVQAEIVFLLAAHEDSSSASKGKNKSSPKPVDWRAVPLRRGALFVVGDPKQSIYRFRRADIEIYNIVRERFSDAVTGRVLPLTMNYRSAPKLCAWANEVFEKQFPPAPTTHSPRFAALDPRDDGDTKAIRKKAGAVGIFTLTHGGPDQRAVLAEDAQKIARFIRNEVDAKRHTYSDFLILTRKKKSRIVPYADALEALNVPIEVSGAGAFGESAEVQALTVLLRAIADPADTLALVNVLRGPLFGVSDPELFAFKQSNGWFSIFFDAVDSAVTLKGGAARVADALASLRGYYRWTRVLPPAAALERILEHTGYLALAATTPGGVEAGDLMHAIDRVSQVVENAGSLMDAADALADDADDSTEVESLPLEPGRSDVVRIMNLHKAKGLEADVVFLADPCGGFKPRVDVHIQRTGDVAHGWFQVVRQSEGSWPGTLLGEHADWATHAAAEEPFLEAEQHRLLYVAATRARQMLVVSRWTRKAKQPAWNALDPFLALATELVVPPVVQIPRVSALDCSTFAQAFDAAARAAAHEIAKDASWSIRSVTAEAGHIARMTRAAEAAAPDDPTRVVVPDTHSHRADAGMAWGSLIHGLLEHAMRHHRTTRDDLRRLAMWLTVEEPQLRTVMDEALDTVERVRRAQFWQQAAAAAHAVEVPFMVATEPARLLAGVIDLIHQEPDGWMITDYKTDAESSPEKAIAYAPQLESYKKALAACGLPVAGATLTPVRAKG